MTGRDRYIDCFKGILILWVIHIHTVFWSGDRYLPEIVRQASLLMDVTVYFFISGYLVRTSDRGRIFRKPARQFARLYGHYIVISLLLLLFAAAGTRMVTGSGFPVSASSLTSVLRVHPEGPPWNFIRIYGPSLWFMRVYFSLLVLVPLVIALSRFRRLRLVLLAALLLLFILQRYHGWDHAFLFTEAVSASFYLAFFLLGVIYKAEENAVRTRHLLISFFFSLLLCGLAFHADGNRLLLQQNKFPPTFQYLFYSLPLVHVFVLARRIEIFRGDAAGRPARFLAWCGKNVFFIYLFQLAVCSLPYLFVPELGRSLPAFPLYGIVLAFNISLTLFVTWAYVLFVRTAFSYLP